MTTTVYLIRHAEPNYENHDDFLRELTQKGLQDSQELVNVFKDISIDVVYSSPYKRAVDTVKPLADDRHLKIILQNDLRERKITDQWIDDFAGFTERQWQDFSYKLAGGESLAEVQKRNISTLQEILSQQSGRTIVIGTHGTALSTIINYYHQQFCLEDFQRVKHIFPWCIKMTFDGLTHLSTKEIDL